MRGATVQESIKEIKRLVEIDDTETPVARMMRGVAQQVHEAKIRRAKYVDLNFAFHQKKSTVHDVIRLLSESLGDMLVGQCIMDTEWYCGDFKFLKNCDKYRINIK